MTQPEALTAAQSRWGDRAYATTIGNAAFVGVRRKRSIGFGDDYDARGWGADFTEAFASATRADAERKEQGRAIRRIRRSAQCSHDRW
jgi:hypothetical protein